MNVLHHCDIRVACNCAGCEAHAQRFLALEHYMRTGVRPPQCGFRATCMLGDGHPQPCYAHEDHSGEGPQPDPPPQRRVLDGNCNARSLKAGGVYCDQITGHVPGNEHRSGWVRWVSGRAKTRG